MYKRYYKTFEDFHDVELIYSIFHKFIGKDVWYCRIWYGFEFRSGYGRNKFEAYRNALKADLQ